MKRWWLVLAGWWALYAWHPQGDPPAWAIFGSYATRAECERGAQSLVLPPVFEFRGCVELPVVPGVDL